MLRSGDYVQTVKHFRRFQTVPRGTRGTVRSLDGDWVTVELPDGGRFETHSNNLTRLLKKKEVA